MVLYIKSVSLHNALICMNIHKAERLYIIKRKANCNKLIYIKILGT